MYKILINIKKKRIKKLEKTTKNKYKNKKDSTKKKKQF